MKTVYLITKILTYPGAFMKGFWEHVACRMLRLRVTDRRYLCFNELCGHVAHAPAMTPAKAYLLSLLPYIAQRILGWVFVGAAAAPLLIFNMRTQAENPLFLLEVAALFLGLSLVCNAFPQWEDAKRHWRLFYGGPTPEEEQAMAEYSEALLEVFDAVETAEPETEAASEEQEEQPVEVPALPEMPEVPRFAGLAGKIILAPCNAYFLAGAWLERFGIPAILAIAITAAVLIVRG